MCSVSKQLILVVLFEQCPERIAHVSLCTFSFQRVTFKVTRIFPAWLHSSYYYTRHWLHWLAFKRGSLLNSAVTLVVLEVGTADRPGEGKLRVSGQNAILPTISSPLRKSFPIDPKHHGSLPIFLPCFRLCGRQHGWCHWRKEEAYGSFWASWICSNTDVAYPSLCCSGVLQEISFFSLSCQQPSSWLQ